METVAGVFRSPAAARRAAIELLRAGYGRDQLDVLSPGGSPEQIEAVRTSEMEPPGVGRAIGGVVGAALGVAGGLELGAGAASILIPGVGPVIAVGILGAALLGTGGLLAGAKLGGAGDEKATAGVPIDEIFFYKDALRKGRSVVILMAKGDEEARRGRELLARQRAESIDAAREAWWIGLRDAEAEHYRISGHNFEQDQEVYRAGFEAALREVCQGKTLDEAADCLKWWYPNIWDAEAFRHGFERGRAHVAAQEKMVAMRP